MAGNRKNLPRRLLLWVKWILIIYFGSTLFFILLYRFVPVPLTPLMVIRLYEQWKEDQPLTLKHDWVPLEEISPSLQLAVVASEDNRFTEHSGFDFGAIEQAMDYNEKKRGKRIRGGSTISQQTAKNVFLWPQRSWIRKGLEVYFTFMIELVWGKRRIMEIYLNSIEMGRGIYGAEAAAANYFRKPAARLTRGESALIAAILPNPRKWSPAAPTSYIRKRQEWILWNMDNIGRIEY